MSHNWLAELEYGGALEIVHEGDDIYFYVRRCIGGVDEDGEYRFVQDGPAEGEKGYVNG